MSCISKKNIIKAFYYLLAIDGHIDAEEQKKFNELALTINNEFEDNIQVILDECDAIIADAHESDEYYEMIVEAFDKAIFSDRNEIYTDVSPRLIVWNMYTLAYVDGELSVNEKKFINHAIRFLEVDKSVSLEMEQMCKTFSDIEREIQWAENSDRKYSSISPIVKELRERQSCIARAAKALIEDDMYNVKPLYVGDIIDEEQGLSSFGSTMSKASRFLDKAAGKIENTVADFGDKSGEILKEGSDVRRDAIQKTGKFINDLAGKIGETRANISRNADSSINKDDEEI